MLPMYPDVGLYLAGGWGVSRPVRYTPVLRRYSPLRIPCPRRFIAPRPYFLDTADIDVSTPPVRRSGATREIRRDRSIVRMHTARPKDVRKKTPGERLVEKFLIRDKKQPAKEAPPRLPPPPPPSPLPDISEAAALDALLVEEQLTAGEKPLPRVPTTKRKSSIPSDVPPTCKSSKQEPIEDAPPRKASLLKRRNTVKLRRSSIDLDLDSVPSSRRSSMADALEPLLEEGGDAPPAAALTPPLKFIVDEISIEESPATPKKFRYEVIVEDVESAEPPKEEPPVIRDDEKVKVKVKGKGVKTKKVVDSAKNKHKQNKTFHKENSTARVEGEVSSSSSSVHTPPVSSAATSPKELPLTDSLHKVDATSKDSSIVVLSCAPPSHVLPDLKLETTTPENIASAKTSTSAPPPPPGEQKGVKIGKLVKKVPKVSNSASEVPVPTLNVSVKPEQRLNSESTPHTDKSQSSSSPLLTGTTTVHDNSDVKENNSSVLAADTIVKLSRDQQLKKDIKTGLCSSNEPSPSLITPEEGAKKQPVLPTAKPKTGCKSESNNSTNLSANESTVSVTLKPKNIKKPLKPTVEAHLVEEKQNLSADAETKRLEEHQSADVSLTVAVQHALVKVSAELHLKENQKPNNSDAIVVNKATNLHSTASSEAINAVVPQQKRQSKTGELKHSKDATSETIVEGKGTSTYLQSSAVTGSPAPKTADESPGMTGKASKTLQSSSVEKTSTQQKATPECDKNKSSQAEQKPPTVAEVHKKEATPSKLEPKTNESKDTKLLGSTSAAKEKSSIDTIENDSMRIKTDKKAIKNTLGISPIVETDLTQSLKIATPVAKNSPKVQEVTTVEISSKPPTSDNTASKPKTSTPAKREIKQKTQLAVSGITSTKTDEVKQQESDNQKETSEGINFWALIKGAEEEYVPRTIFRTNSEPNKTKEATHESLQKKNSVRKQDENTASQASGMGAALSLDNLNIADKVPPGKAPKSKLAKLKIAAHDDTKHIGRQKTENSAQKKTGEQPETFSVKPSPVGTVEDLQNLQGSSAGDETVGSSVAQIIAADMKGKIGSAIGSEIQIVKNHDDSTATNEPQAIASKKIAVNKFEKQKEDKQIGSKLPGKPPLKQISKQLSDSKLLLLDGEQNNDKPGKIKMPSSAEIIDGTMKLPLKDKRPGKGNERNRTKSSSDDSTSESVLPALQKEKLFSEKPPLAPKKSKKILPQSPGDQLNQKYEEAKCIPVSNQSQKPVELPDKKIKEDDDKENELEKSSVPSLIIPKEEDSKSVLQSTSLDSATVSNVKAALKQDKSRSKSPASTSPSDVASTKQISKLQIKPQKKAIKPSKTTDLSQIDSTTTHLDSEPPQPRSASPNIGKGVDEYFLGAKPFQNFTTSSQLEPKNEINVAKNDMHEQQNQKSAEKINDKANKIKEDTRKTTDDNSNHKLDSNRKQVKPKVVGKNTVECVSGYKSLEIETEKEKLNAKLENKLDSKEDPPDTKKIPETFVGNTEKIPEILKNKQADESSKQKQKPPAGKLKISEKQPTTDSEATKPLQAITVEKKAPAKSDTKVDSDLTPKTNTLKQNTGESQAIKSDELAIFVAEKEVNENNAVQLNTQEKAKKAGKEFVEDMKSPPAAVLTKKTPEVKDTKLASKENIALKLNIPKKIDVKNDKPCEAPKKKLDEINSHVVKTKNAQKGIAKTEDSKNTDVDGNGKQNNASKFSSADNDSVSSISISDKGKLAPHKLGTTEATTSSSAENDAKVADSDLPKVKKVQKVKDIKVPKQIENDKAILSNKTQEKDKDSSKEISHETIPQKVFKDKTSKAVEKSPAEIKVQKDGNSSRITKAPVGVDEEGSKIPDISPKSAQDSKVSEKEATNVTVLKKKQKQKQNTSEKIDESPQQISTNEAPSPDTVLPNDSKKDAVDVAKEQGKSGGSESVQTDIEDKTEECKRTEISIPESEHQSTTTKSVSQKSDRTLDPSSALDRTLDRDSSATDANRQNSETDVVVPSDYEDERTSIKEEDSAPRSSTSSDDSGFDSLPVPSVGSERDGGSPLANNPALSLSLDDGPRPPAQSIPRFRKYCAEDFQFLKVLGKGSFGKVLLAELRGTDRYYAVKCLKKDVVLEDNDVECTLIERKVLALGTKHPYLCHLFCTFQTESHLLFVLEYLNGGDLMFHIQQSGRFPEPRARFYAAEIVSGLKFLHKKGIVYRDLKLDNILLDFEGHIRIADFGMCKLQIFLDRMADTFCGTPDYMAPEIIRGQRYNQCVDWWSFGILLYEMLIGVSPFSGCDDNELFWSICNETPHYPRFLTVEANKILMLLLEKDINKRLGTPECSAGDVCDQPFFRCIDWDALERRELEPPFRPKVQHPLDVQYFDTTFTTERAQLTPIDRGILETMDQAQFHGFSYTNPYATD